MKLFRCTWLLLLVWGFYFNVAVKTSLKRRLAAESSDEEPLGVPTSSNSAGKRGGIRQRLLEGTSEEPISSQDGPFTRDLKRKWAKGELSSAAVQSLASSASSQGAHSLEKIAASGTDGILYFVQVL